MGKNMLACQEFIKAGEVRKSTPLTYFYNDFKCLTSIFGHINLSSVILNQHNHTELH